MMRNESMPMRSWRWSSSVTVMIMLALLVGGIAYAADDHHGHKPAAQSVPGKADGNKIQADYRIPELKLVRADGKEVSFPKELNDGRPVILNFIFTSCSAVCPVMTQTFAGLQQRLGADRAKIHMVSITIDPEEDTPQRLTEYARQYHAEPQWQFYTGSVAASISMQRAFDSYRGDKMNHAPVTFMRLAPDKPWLRIDGIVGPDELANEYRLLAAAK
jgi:protein SCO1